MTQEEKDLLLKDLCNRLPYGVQLKVTGGEFDLYSNNYLLTAISKFGFETKCKVYHPVYTPMGCPNIENVKPYLRPMSSMTKEEIEELKKLSSGVVWRKDVLHDIVLDIWYSTDAIDYLNAKHFDYRGLIPMGLALPATEGMYK